MLRRIVSVLAIAAIAAITLQAQAASWYRVRANLNGPTLASGKADYRERMQKGILQQRFSVEVEDATPGDLLTVAVNGTVFGIMVVDDLGRAELQYRTPAFIDDPGDGDPIPDGFPTLVPGDSITVGPLSGVFVLH